MAENAPPQGARFSPVYGQRGEPTQDSSRMRLRLASVFLDLASAKDRDELARLVSQELGVAVP